MEQDSAGMRGDQLAVECKVAIELLGELKMGFDLLAIPGS
jgi:hypothetical protein